MSLPSKDREFSMLQVEQSASSPANGLLIVIDNIVYNVDKFLDDHPGGSRVLQRMVGRDASKQFWKYHNEHVLEKYGPKLRVGVIREKAKL